MPPHSKICIIDTNALLNDPDVINSFSGAQVIIPAAVLKELDDLKRRRTDARVRYYGRKATRMLFEASRNGRLIDGVRLANGAVLRVDATDTFEDLPADLDPSRTDDLILALAHTYEKQPGVHATVVTNDLNMLLRAEAMGLDAYRFEGKLDSMKRRRRSLEERLMDEWLVVVLCLIIVALAASTIFLYATRPAPGLSAEIPGLDPSTLRDLGVSSQVLESHYRDRLEQNPDDFDALTNLGNLLFDDGRYLEAVDYYTRALALRPGDADVRTDMGIAQIRLGHQRDAVKAFEQAIVDEPSHALAHYNLGVALAQQGDRTEAISHLQAALTLAAQGSVGVPVADAQLLIQQLERASPSSSSTVASP